MTNQTQKTRRAAMQARNAMQGVRPSDVAAMRDLQDDDPQTLAALVAGVVGMTTAGQDDPDVTAVAAATVARMWRDRRNGAPIPAVVAYAVRMARQTLALASWDECAGDMTDMATLVGGEYREGDERTTLSRYGTAPADARWDMTYGDVVATACTTVPTGERVTLERVADEWLAHERSGCCSGAGRRVTLQGITAHGEGWEASDSRYHASRRAAVRALRMVDREATLSATGAPGARPSYGANRVSVGNGSPSHERPTTLPGRPAVTLPAVTVERVADVTTDHVWDGGDWQTRVWAWDGSRVVTVPAWVARRESWRVTDEQGYPVGLHYGPGRASGSWRAVRESRVTVTTLPAVTVPARPTLPAPDVIVTRDASGNVTVRAMTEAERDAVRDRDAGRAERTDDGETPATRPDDRPARRAGDDPDRLPSGKVPASPRARVGGQTGPTVPARLTR